MPDTDPHALPITADDIVAAAGVIRDHVKHTLFQYSGRLSRSVNCKLYLKHEHQQVTGSFKERGACYALHQLTDEQKQRGVIAASAGNHALAIAFHGQRMGIPVTVIMPEFAPLVKVSNCRGYGATVELHGQSLGDAKVLAEQYVQERGLTYINGYDDPNVIAGAGTIGLELLAGAEPRDDETLDAVVVPVGGGGLIAGIALAIKSQRPQVQVIGVEPSRAASLTAALNAGHPVNTDLSPTLADGLAVSMVGSNAFAIARQHVDRVVTVTEQQIALAVLRLVEREKTLVEGAGAAGLAAVLAGVLPELEGKRVAVPLCGGNIDLTLLGRLIDRGLAADGRLCRLFAEISDRPGGLAQFTALLAKLGVSIRQITHDRVFAGDDIATVEIECLIETRDAEHLHAVCQRLTTEGIRFSDKSLGA